jgi:hypothetical protein
MPLGKTIMFSKTRIQSPVGQANKIRNLEKTIKLSKTRIQSPVGQANKIRNPTRKAIEE